MCKLTGWRNVPGALLQAHFSGICVGKCEGAPNSGPRVPSCERLPLVSSCGRALARQLWWRQLSDDLAHTWREEAQ